MQFIVVFVLLFVSSSVTAGLRKPTCKVLALEGGGTNGAFQVGAFNAMVDLIPPDDIKYDVITGASVGVVNGLAIASSRIGEERVGAKNLFDTWNMMTARNFYDHWFFLGPVRGLLDKGSFLDNSPMGPYIERMFKQKLGGHLQRLFTLGIVDAKTGKYLTFDGTVGDDKIASYVLASASVPGVFQYLVKPDYTYIDGGTTDNLNLRGGIAQCRKIVGDDDSAITIDIILNDPFLNISSEGIDSDTVSYTIYSRANEIRSDIKDVWYVKDAMRAYPNANWRYLISPKEELPNYPVLPLNFDAEVVKKIREIGYKDTSDIIKAGSSNAKAAVFRKKGVKRMKLR